MALVHNFWMCPICSDTDCLCPEGESTECDNNPPPKCIICGDTDCVCPDPE